MYIYIYSVELFDFLQRTKVAKKNLSPCRFCGHMVGVKVSQLPRIRLLYKLPLLDFVGVGVVCAIYSGPGPGVF